MPQHPPLTCYWIEFARSDPFFVDEETPATPRAFGVTAASVDDALTLVRDLVFRGGSLPVIERVIPNIDPAMLTLWNMSPLSLPRDAPAIWYPPFGAAR